MIKFKEPFNGISHLLGGMAAVVVTVLLVRAAALRGAVRGGRPLPCLRPQHGPPVLRQRLVPPARRQSEGPRHAATARPHQHLHPHRGHLHAHVPHRAAGKRRDIALLGGVGTGRGRHPHRHLLARRPPWHQGRTATFCLAGSPCGRRSRFSVPSGGAAWPGCWPEDLLTASGPCCTRSRGRIPGPASSASTRSGTCLCWRAVQAS